MHILKRDINRQVLTRNIDNLVLVSGHFTRNAVFDGLIVCFQVGGDDGEGFEGGDTGFGDEIHARAGSGDDDALEEGECEGGTLGCEEGGGGGDFLLHGAVEAVLLGFLGDDAAQQVDEGEFVAAVGGEDGLGLWEDAQHDVREGVGEGDGGEEVGDGEFVLAWFDLRGACGLEDAVCAEGVEFFLVLDGADGVDDVLAVPRGGHLVAVRVVGDVLQQGGEVCNLEFLVERDQLQGCDGPGGERLGQRSTWQRAASLFLNLHELLGGGGGIAILVGGGSGQGRACESEEGEGGLELHRDWKVERCRGDD